MEHLVEENHFLNGSRQPSETDIALAVAYYPMLIELAVERRTMSFNEFVKRAKNRYPENPFVQSAIPTSTGRRLEFIRIFTKKNGLPDLSVWITNKDGKNSTSYENDFDAKNERDKSAMLNWIDYQDAWDEHKLYLKKLAIRLTRRKEKEALSLMAKFALEMRPRIQAAIPNPHSLSYDKLVRQFREPILEGLMEGRDPENVLQDVIFDARSSRSSLIS